MTHATLGADWRNLSACRGADPDEFFPDNPADDSAAKAYCRGCPVVANCLQWALETGSDSGIFGGLSEQRRAIQHYRYGLIHQSSVVGIEPPKRQRELTSYEVVQLNDLSVGRGLGARWAYRRRIAELYLDGVTKASLLGVGGVSNERYLCRATDEYRLAHGIEWSFVNYPLPPAPEESRALANFRQLAAGAPSAAARAYWHARVQLQLRLEADNEAVSHPRSA